MSKTIQETIDSLHQSLKDYIEATYHISNAQLIAQRRKLLDKVGVIHQVPYLESTRRYHTGKRFEDIEDLPKAALAVYSALSSKEDDLPILLHNPAYTHQADAISHALVEKKNLLIMTGTGSGKTESFLMPILGKLAQEGGADENLDHQGGSSCIPTQTDFERLSSISGWASDLTRPFASWGIPPRMR